MDVAQMYRFLLLQLDQAARVAGVYLINMRRHRVQALQEGVVPVEDDEAVLIVCIIIADLGIYIVEARLMHSQDAVVDAEMLLPLIVAAGGGMPHIHVPLISCPNTQRLVSSHIGIIFLLTVEPNGRLVMRHLPIQVEMGCSRERSPAAGRIVIGGFR